MFLLANCKKDSFNIENLNHNNILALGHGGMGYGNYYPLDNYESVQKCLSIGMDGSEFDLQLTKDSVLVLYHGADLSEWTDRKGMVNQFTWEEIKGTQFKERPYQNYSITSLEELFSHTKNLQSYHFAFDCKLFSYNVDFNKFLATYIDAINRIVVKYQLEDNIFIEAQDTTFLKLFKQKFPSYKLYIYPPSFESGLATALRLGLYGITISTRMLTKEQVALAHANNLRVATWSTHTQKQNIEAIQKNPDIIETDEHLSLLRLLKRGKK